MSVADIQHYCVCLVQELSCAYEWVKPIVFSVVKLYAWCIIVEIHSFACKELQDV